MAQSLGEGDKKPQVLALMAEGHGVIADWAAGLAQAQRSASPDESGWGAKANLAHMAHWNHALLNALEIRATGKPVPYQWADLDGQNARVLAESAGRPWGDVAGDAEAVYTALRLWAERLSEDDLAMPDDFAWCDHVPLWQTFLGNTYFHYLDHLAEHLAEAGQAGQAADLRVRLHKVSRALGLDWY